MSEELPRYKIVESENGVNGVTVERDDKKGSIYLVGEAKKYMEKLEAERDALRAKLDLIDLKFKSGNSIPVERITVKRDEFYKLEGAR